MEIVKATINGDFTMMLPKHRADRPEWYNDQGWEKERLRSMYKNIGTEDTVYYIGAELGEMPTLLSRFGADVVLFEPNPNAWPVIKATYDANGLKPYKCFDGFASDITKPAPRTVLYREDGWPLAVEGEITEAHGFNNLSQEADDFAQFKIDDYVSQTGIIPTVITMDVEGAEGRVLRGAEHTIRKYKPKMWISIHPEFMITQYNEWSRELRDWIIGLGYRETILDYQHEIHVYYETI